MSTKCSLIYFETEDFMFHMYDCFVVGYGIDIRFKTFETTLLIDEAQAKEIIRQLKAESEEK